MSKEIICCWQCGLLKVGLNKVWQWFGELYPDEILLFYVSVTVQWTQGVGVFDDLSESHTQTLNKLSALVCGAKIYVYFLPREK